MLNTKMKRSALSLILAVVLMFSVFSVSVFAETETEVDGTEADVTETEAITDGTTTDDGHDHDHDHDHEDEEEEKKGLTTFDIVSLIILGVLIIVGAVYCIKNREKVGKFLRSLKSEFKKISWSSWRDVRKNTLVVVVVVVAVAIVIGGVDFLFSRGILALKSILS